MMARSSKLSSILKDVVAYVDVWSSSKTENYSKPFIDQLREMGAEVSSTFTKHVTHVVFKDGHQGTWNKAKKVGTKIVSVLWLARCEEEAKCVDEELFPAQNDEGNCLLNKKRHRCMQPKDPAEKTPENNRRMKKKLDQMMKDLTPRSPVFADVSPYIINEENGIIYSPSMKRSDSMAQRLKEMREKRENLSPTASQMVEAASSSPGVRPRFGFSPTILKMLDEVSDEESSSLMSHPRHSPDERGESKRHVDTGTQPIAEKPWLSPCSDVPKRKSLIHLKKFNSEDGLPEEVRSHTKSRRSTMKNKLLLKQSSSEVPCQDPKAELPENPKTRKLRQSTLKFDSSAVNKSLPDDVNPERQRTKPVASSKTHSITSPDELSSPSCLSSPELNLNIQVNEQLTKDVFFLLKKADLPTPKNKRRASLSLSTLPSEPLSVAPSLLEDSVFEDYFSPANHKPIQKMPPLPSLPIESRIQFPFELASMSGRRKRGRSETSAPQNKKRKQKELQCSSTNSSDHQCSDVHDKPAAHPRVPGPFPNFIVGPSDSLVPRVRAKSRLKTLPVMNMYEFETEVVKHRIPSNPMETLSPIESSTAYGQHTQSEGNVHSVAMESGGSQQTAAAGETSSEDETSLVKMDQTKATRTLVTTSMSTDKQQIVAQVVKLLGGFLIVDSVCETTTHLVSGGHGRTLNVLFAIARGCWILSFEWMLRCLEQRRWLPEEPYELSDYFPAAPICRLQQHLSAGEHQQDLFQGQPAMFVSQQAQPPPQSLVKLIQLCGGTVCKSVRQAGICIGRPHGQSPKGSKILSEKWVLDCIMQLKPLSYENYHLD